MALSIAELTAIKRGFTGTFNIALDQVNTFYPRVSMIVPSRGADEQYGFIGAMPGMREWLGDRIFKQLLAGDYTIKNRLWESSLLIDRFHLEDDRVGLYGPLLQDLATEAGTHPDELWSNLLLTGETELCWDGKAFFATDHEWGESGSQSNLLDADPAAGAGSAITALDFKNAYTTSRLTMARYKNDQGKNFIRTVLPNFSDLMVFLPPELEEVANEALRTGNFQFVSGVGGDNVVINTPSQIVPSPVLTDLRSFYLFYLGRPIKPFVFQNRTPLRSGMKGNTDIEFKDLKFMTEARYNVGYGLWATAIKFSFN